ncbi:MAG: hypothetical protein M1825_004698 [Sarcosagium campestre]|nr:MAG: hypothetical protein M1825_004698 [Sarcosagium campestre]
MASSVLGKRLRSAAQSTEYSVTTRAKRRARGTRALNNENEDPFVTRGSALEGQQLGSTDVDKVMHDDARTSPVKEDEKQSVTPRKLNASVERVVLSPSKINVHFKTSKLVQDESTKDVENAVPQTPHRHRDTVSQKMLVTPRRHAPLVGKSLTPKMPKTPRTPSTPNSSIPTIYNHARQLFVRSATPARLIGRDTEREELLGFMQSRIESKSGGCLYVSGPPGTGKSALVNEVSEQFADTKLVKKTSINCMSVKSSKDLYDRLASDLGGDGDRPGSLSPQYLERLFFGDGSSPSYLITLDEIDHLLALDLELLYMLFEWSLKPSSRLILIGIANALDLTDRFLPRLKSRNLKPELLPFLPYTVPQIVSVITTKLQSLNQQASGEPSAWVPFMHPAAIQLCARKVAGQTGDLRKAFDICRRTIDVIESETKLKTVRQVAEQEVQASPSKTPLAVNTNLSSPSSGKGGDGVASARSSARSLSEAMSELTAADAPRANIGHMARICSSALGNGASQRLQCLNLQQKAALCALVALERRKREGLANVLATPSKTANAAPTIRMLYDSYTTLCKNDGMLHPLTSTEFRDVVGSLETLSLVSPVDGRGGAFSITPGTPSKRGRAPRMGPGNLDDRRVGSCVGEKEMEQAVEGVGSGILRALLKGDGLK